MSAQRALWNSQACATIPTLYYVGDFSVAHETLPLNLYLYAFTPQLLVLITQPFTGNKEIPSVWTLDS